MNKDTIELKQINDLLNTEHLGIDARNRIAKAMLEAGTNELNWITKGLIPNKGERHE